MANNALELLEMNTKATLAFRGKVIKQIRYMTEAEMKKNYWTKRGPIIWFTDGTYMMPVADDEGNESGVLETNVKGFELLCSM